MNIIIKKVVSGGQTGVDRAALDSATLSGIPCGGWCPKGRLALDGRIPDCYPLQETPTASYRQRTRWNVRDSDGTLIICRGSVKGGTALTLRYARELDKPAFILNMDYAKMRREATLEMVSKWLLDHAIQTLNIAGPREGDSQDIYASTLQLLKELWKEKMVTSHPDDKHPS